jgi:hypothetical protein
MKGKLRNSLKKVQKTSLHMKRKILNSENEKYFDFPKMDKKNVQNRYVKTLLTDGIFLHDVEKLWCKFKR